MDEINSLQYEYFHILGRDIKESTYYVGRSKNSTFKSVDYCWCKSYESLKVGKIVYGYLSMPASYNLTKLPMLVVSN